MDVPQIFNSVEEECCYWKETAKRFYQDKIDVQLELEDYTEESKQLETELEALLQQSDKTNKDLRDTINQLQLENDNIKKKLLTYEQENNSLDEQLRNIRSERDEYRNYLRELEQKNDDLKRAHRIIAENVVSFEQQLNQAYEKNALLESEIDEKELLQVKLQRLMDETRDLKQELNVKNRSPSRLTDKTDDNQIIFGKQLTMNNTTINNEQGIIVNPIVTTNINQKLQSNIVQTQTIGTSTTINNSLHHPNQNTINKRISALALQDTNNYQNNINNNNVTANNNLGATGITVGETVDLHGGSGTAMTPSNRATSLKLISDLLQQFNHFEATLRSCIIIPPQQSSKINALMDKANKKDDE